MRSDIAEKLKAGGCTLYFDINAIRGKRAVDVKLFNDFCRQIQRLQLRDDRAPTVKVFVVNYFEMVHQLRREIPGFNESIISASLKTLDVPIVPLDSIRANECARSLHSWFPTLESWSDAKKPAKDKATIDWLISTHVCAVDAILVTSDEGNEFRSAPIAQRCVKRTELTQFIESWLVESSNS